MKHDDVEGLNISVLPHAPQDFLRQKARSCARDECESKKHGRIVKDVERAEPEGGGEELTHIVRECARDAEQRKRHARGGAQQEDADRKRQKAARKAERQRGQAAREDRSEHDAQDKQQERFPRAKETERGDGHDVRETELEARHRRDERQAKLDEEEHQRECEADGKKRQPRRPLLRQPRFLRSLCAYTRPRLGRTLPSAALSPCAPHLATASGASASTAASPALPAFAQRISRRCGRQMIGAPSPFNSPVCTQI